MKTFQESYYLEDAGLFRRLRRDLGLLLYISKMIWMWTVVGGRVRRDYTRCEDRDEIYWIDHLDGDNF
jgi:hypothetical protein